MTVDHYITRNEYKRSLRRVLAAVAFAALIGLLAAGFGWLNVHGLVNERTDRRQQVDQKFASLCPLLAQAPAVNLARLHQAETILGCKLTAPPSESP